MYWKRLYRSLRRSCAHEDNPFQHVCAAGPQMLHVLGVIWCENLLWCYEIERLWRTCPLRVAWTASPKYGAKVNESRSMHRMSFWFCTCLWLHTLCCTSYFMLKIVSWFLSSETENLVWASEQFFDTWLLLCSLKPDIRFVKCKSVYLMGTFYYSLHLLDFGTLNCQLKFRGCNTLQYFIFGSGQITSGSCDQKRRLLGPSSLQVRQFCPGRRWVVADKRTTLTYPMTCRKLSWAPWCSLPPHERDY